MAAMRGSKPLLSVRRYPCKKQESKTCRALSVVVFHPQKVSLRAALFSVGSSQTVPESPPFVPPFKLAVARVCVAVAGPCNRRFLDVAPKDKQEGFLGFWRQFLRLFLGFLDVSRVFVCSTKNPTPNVRKLHRQVSTQTTRTS